jgi:hypothetical protein
VVLGGLFLNQKSTLKKAPIQNWKEMIFVYGGELPGEVRVEICLIMMAG